MGRIKSIAIKRTAKTLINGNYEEFTTKFDENKELLKGYTLPDKGTRNKIAGHITRLKLQAKAEKSKITKE